MRDEQMQLLFHSLGQILFNQDKIKKHLGLNKCDSEYGWDDEETMKLARDCTETADEFKHEDDSRSYW